MKIEHYEFGKIVIDGKGYTKDVIVYPDRINSNWWRKEGHELAVSDLNEVMNESFEVLIVGTGYSGCMKILKETEEYLKNKEIELIAKKSEEACNLFNELNKKKRVIGAIHLTC